MLTEFKDFKVLILCIIPIILAIGGSYYVGKQDQEKIQAQQIAKLQADNAHILQQKESQTMQITHQYNQAIQELIIKNERLQNEIQTNAKQINSTNHFTKQFSSLLNSSTGAKPSITTNTGNVAESGQCEASQLLSVMVENNVNHQECVHQVKLWQDWYKLNFGK